MTDVFISYKSEENDLALSIKKVLETNGFSCWKAPESIPPASDYTCEITDAITGCRVMIIVLSEKAQESRHIQSEVRLAFDRGKPIIPFHVDTSDLNKQFDYYLSNSQRVEAFRRLDSAYSEMLNAVAGIVRGRDGLPAEPAPAHKMIEEKPEYRIFFGIGQRYTLFFYSPESASKSDPSYYSFTREEWDAFADAVTSVISVILSVSPDMISVTYKGKFGDHACAPVDGYNYYDTAFRSEFGVSCIDNNSREAFGTFQVDVSENDLTLSLYSEGKYAGCESIAAAGIDETALITAAKTLLTLCAPGKTIVCGNSFKLCNSVFKLSYIKK